MDIPFLISHSGKVTKNPLIKISRDSIYVIWNEDYYGIGKWEIFRRAKKVTELPSMWTEILFVSENY